MPRRKRPQPGEEEIFQCRQCGYCCQGETTVSLEPGDVDRLVAHLRLPRAEVFEKYLRVTGNVVQMKTVDSHCIFYNQGCTVHEGKPWRCRQWPLHPSMLDDEANYLAISQSCPGIRKELDYSEFCAKFDGILNEQGKGK